MKKIKSACLQAHTMPNNNKEMQQNNLLENSGFIVILLKMRFIVIFAKDTAIYTAE